MNSFLVWSIYITFSLSVVHCTFYKSTIKSNCILLLCQVRVRSSRQELFCEKGVLRNFAKFRKTGVSVNFAKFLRTSFLIEDHRLLLLTFQSESTLYNFRTSWSKQTQYLKFKWTKTSWKYNCSNIVQTSFLCYVAGF